MSEQLARLVETELGPRAPERYVRFLRDREYEALDYLELRSGFVEGRFLPSFDDSRLFGSISELAHAVGIRSLDARRWALEFTEFLPLAVLQPTEPGEATDDVGALMVLSWQGPRVPVYLLVREYCMVVPVADSLDSFLQGRPWAEWTSVSRSVVEPYRAYGWSRSERVSRRR